MTLDERKPRTRQSSVPPKRSRQGLWILLLIVVALGALVLLRSIQQKTERVTLRVAVRQGDALAYRVTMNPGSEPSAADAADARSVSVALAVTGVSNTGVATIEATVRTVAEVVNERALAHGDVFLPLHLPLSTQARLDLDPDGKAVVASDPAPPEALARFLAELFTPLPGRPVAPEERWHTESKAKNDGMEVDLELSRWITSIEDDSVLVRIDGAVTMQPVRTDEFDDEGNKTRMALRGSERISRRDGLLLERSLVAKTSVEKPGAFGDTDLRLKPFLTISWVRTSADAAAK
jgi:hypothetical protein